MPFHHGHKTTPEHKARLFGAAHPEAAAAPFPLAAALRSFRPPQLNQGPTSTCFAHAQVALVVITLAAAGTPLLWVPSPLVIARNTYCEEQTDVTIALQDTGADMGDVMLACAREGISPMRALAIENGVVRYSDVTAEAIALRPTLADDELSANELLLGAEQLQPSATDFMAQCATSIANMRCGVSTGIHSSPAFENWKAGDPALTDTSGFTADDGHDVAMTDYRTNPETGALEVWLLSSWGPWGEEGGAWVSASWLIGGGCLEAWRMRVVASAATSQAAA